MMFNLYALSATDTTDLLDTLPTVAELLQDLPTSTEEAGEYVSRLWQLLEEFAVTYGGKFIFAVLLLIVGFKLANMMTGRVAKSRALKKLDSSAQIMVNNVLGALLKIIIVITALAILGIPMSSIVAVIGSCGLAIGLALQGSLANIAGGFIILLLKPFKKGDFIKSGDISGKVEDVGIFHTHIITVDNTCVVIPNSTISNATLTNVSAMAQRRIDLTFTASYDDDIRTVENVLLSVCEKHEKVLDTPAPFARLSAHNDSALQYTVRVWCETDDYWDVYFDLIRDVKYAFDENKISIPYPQLDVHKQS